LKQLFEKNRVNSIVYPHPKMWHWFNNWSKLSNIHDTIGIGFLPVPASSHVGVGGGGAHDTRITFMPPNVIRFAQSSSYGE
jgi:hypothetical protein